MGAGRYLQMLLFSFFKFFVENQSLFLFVGPLYPPPRLCFRLLVTSVLGFIARVDPLLTHFIACIQWIPQIHLWCNTCNLLVANMVAEPFPIHILAHVQALVGLQSGSEHAAASQHMTAD